MGDFYKDEDREFSTDLAVIDKFMIVLGMLHRDIQLVLRYADPRGDNAEFDYQEEMVSSVRNSHLVYDVVIEDIKFAVDEAIIALENTQERLRVQANPAASGPSGYKHTSVHRSSVRPPPPSPSTDSEPHQLTRLHKRNVLPTSPGPSNHHRQPVPIQPPPRALAVAKTKVPQQDPARNTSSPTVHPKPTGVQRKARVTNLQETLRRFPAPSVHVADHVPHHRSPSRESETQRMPSPAMSDSSFTIAPLPSPIMSPHRSLAESLFPETLLDIRQRTQSTTPDGRSRSREPDPGVVASPAPRPLTPQNPAPQSPALQSPTPQPHFSQPQAPSPQPQAPSPQPRAPSQQPQSPPPQPQSPAATPSPPPASSRGKGRVRVPEGQEPAAVPAKVWH